MLAKISSGLKAESLYRVGLGTYKTFDVEPTLENITQLSLVVKNFLEMGGKLIDSSPMYGRAETVLGHIFAKLNIPNQNFSEDIFMATKVWTQGKDQGVKQMLDSFTKLKREKIELMQIHNLLDWKTQLKTLQKMKAEGSIKYIGITHYSESAFMELEKIIRSENIDFLQIPYNLIRNSAEDFLIPLAAEKNMAVIANEPFGHGSLFQKSVEHKQLPAWATELGIENWSQYFLKYILGNQNVQFVIPATKSLLHLKENMLAATGVLPNPVQREKMRNEFID